MDGILGRRNVTAARHAGLQATLFTGAEAFARHLNEMGIPVRSGRTPLPWRQ